jgi:Taurine catabolism dioxygenase TauD, TfdA family
LSENRNKFIARASQEYYSVLNGKYFTILNNVMLSEFYEFVAYLRSQTRTSLVTYPSSKYGNLDIHQLSGNPKPLIDAGIDWHTEDSFAPIPPNIIVLFCIKGSTKVSTKIGELTAVNANAVEKFDVRSDPFLYGLKKNTQLPVVFPSAFGNLGIRYDPALIPLGAQHVEISRCESVVLAAGDMLVINNHIAAHARDGIDTATERQLLRVIVNVK